MEDTIRGILETRGVSLKNPEIEKVITGFSCLGVAPRVSEIDTSEGDVHVWIISPNSLPISGNELIRWGFSAPRGRHWLLSLREVPSGLVEIDGLEYVIWTPERVTKWIGEAVLSGDMKAQPIHEIEPDSPDSENGENNPGIPDMAMRPRLEIENWLSQRGLDGEQYNPVFLEAKIWEVSGNLIGPNGELEGGNWKLYEDPWTRTLSILEPDELSANPPNLRVISPPAKSWLTQSRLSEEASKLLEIRRKGETDISGSSTVRSMLLQRWSLDSSSSTFAEFRLFLPAWIVSNPDESVLHARNGRTYEI